VRRILAGCGEYNFSGRALAPEPGPAQPKVFKKIKFFGRGGMPGNKGKCVEGEGTMSRLPPEFDHLENLLRRNLKKP